MPRNKKQLTENQKEYNRLLKQARANVTRMRNKGYYIPEAESITNPKKPKRITKKYLEKMKRDVSAKELKKTKVFELEPATGEIITVAESEKRKRRAKRRKDKETRDIINNALDIINNARSEFDDAKPILIDEIERQIAEKGLEETAEMLQRMAEQEAGILDEMLEEKYREADSMIQDQWGVSISELNEDQLRHYRYLALKTIEKARE